MRVRRGDLCCPWSDGQQACDLFGFFFPLIATSLCPLQKVKALFLMFASVFRGFWTGLRPEETSFIRILIGGVDFFFFNLFCCCCFLFKTGGCAAGLCTRCCEPLGKPHSRYARAPRWKNPLLERGRPALPSLPCSLPYPGAADSPPALPAPLLGFSRVNALVT